MHPAQTHFTEPNDGVISAIRVRNQFPLVHTDLHHSLPQQNRRLQSEAPKGPVGEVFPGLCGRSRRQQGCQVYPMEIHAGEPREAEHLPPVRPLASSRILHADDNASLTQATDTGNVRLVFAAVKETILQNALRDSGIL